jgi:hypothetical protein
VRTRSIRIAPAIGILLFVINVLAQSRREFKRQIGHQLPRNPARGRRGVERPKGPLRASHIFLRRVPAFEQPHGAEDYNQLFIGGVMCRTFSDLNNPHAFLVV